MSLRRIQVDVIILYFTIIYKIQNRTKKESGGGGGVGDGVRRGIIIFFMTINIVASTKLRA